MHPKNGGKISISKFSPILVAITEQGRCFWPASSALKVTKSQNVLSISFFLLKMYEIILPNTSWWTVIVIILMKLGQNWKYPLIFNHLLLLDLTFAYLMKDLFIIPASKSQEECWVSFFILNTAWPTKFAWMNLRKPQNQNEIKFIFLYWKKRLQSTIGWVDIF